jgi:hypothetical protein
MTKFQGVITDDLMPTTKNPYCRICCTTEHAAGPCPMATTYLCINGCGGTAWAAGKCTTCMRRGIAIDRQHNAQRQRIAGN